MQRAEAACAVPAGRTEGSHAISEPTLKNMGREKHGQAICGKFRLSQTLISKEKAGYENTPPFLMLCKASPDEVPWAHKEKLLVLFGCRSLRSLSLCRSFQGLMRCRSLQGLMRCRSLQGLMRCRSLQGLMRCRSLSLH